MKNFKIYPGMLAIALTLSLVSCHNDKVRREQELRDSTKNLLNSVPIIQVEDLIKPTEEIVEVEVHKSK